MSKKNIESTPAEAKPTVQPSESAPPAEAAAPTAAVPAPAQPEDELTALRREVAELRDKNLRLLAELQNTQKRAQREKQEALRFAEFELARELLPVLDDLERTQASAKTATDVQAVADGVRITYEHLLKTLHGRDITPIAAAGQPFDPTFHEALLQQPSDEHPAGTVVQEVARGYTMHERVVRPSRVIVSSGPQAGAPAAGKKPMESTKES